MHSNVLWFMDQYNSRGFSRMKPYLSHIAQQNHSPQISLLLAHLNKFLYDIKLWSLCNNKTEETSFILNSSSNQNRNVYSSSVHIFPNVIQDAAHLSTWCSFITITTPSHTSHFYLSLYSPDQKSSTERLYISLRFIHILLSNNFSIIITSFFNMMKFDTGFI